MLASVPAQPVPPKLSASSIYVRGPKLTQEELHERSQAALEVVQREGLPNLVERCRNGSDAEKEQAALTLSFIATHDSNCAGMIVSAGGIQPLISMLGVEDGRGDADPSLDMKEQAVKTIRDLCVLLAHEYNVTLPIASTCLAVAAITFGCHTPATHRLFSQVHRRAGQPASHRRERSDTSSAHHPRRADAPAQHQGGSRRGPRPACVRVSWWAGTGDPHAARRSECAEYTRT